MDLSNFFGYTATVISVTSLIPQIVKIWKTKSTGDISISSFIILCTATFFWTLYGINVASIQIIIANVLIFLFSLSLLLLKMKYK